MTLKEKIDDYKKQSAGKASPEMVEIMQRSTAELQATVPERALPQVGAKLPEFSLLDSSGNKVTSAELLKSGPLVMTFFRGMW